jgi:plastocyanin
MELIPKVGIIVGIAAVIIMMPFMVMTQYSFLSQEFGSLFIDQEAILNEFHQYDSYKSFVEKFPDNYERDWTDRSGSVSLEVYAYNFNTGNQLELGLRYNSYDDRIRENIRCDIKDGSLRQKLGYSTAYALAAQSSSLPGIFLEQGRAEDQFVTDFIKYTNCLEVGDEESQVKKTSAPDEDDTVSHYISIPEGTAAPGCEVTAGCFLPVSLNVTSGDTVQWRNFDAAAHTVTSGTPEDGPFNTFDSGLFMAGQTFEVTFEKSGTIPYFCMVHPWMIGTIIVEDIEPITDAMPTPVNGQITDSVQVKTPGFKHLDK